MLAVELMMRRRNVRAFIMADPIQIVLNRTIKVPTAGGGWKTEALPPLPPQTVRIDPGKRRLGDMSVNTEAGNIPLWPYMLQGFHYMDIQEGDHFVWEGYSGSNNHFEVKSIEEVRRDEITTAWLDYYGSG